MAGPNAVYDKGFPAGEALTKFHGVTLETNGNVDMADAQGEAIIGVTQEYATTEDAGLGRIVNVRLLGITRAIAGAEIARGVAVTVTAAGRFEPALTGDFVAGVAMSGPSVNGDQFDLFLTPSRVPLA